MSDPANTPYDNDAVETIHELSHQFNRNLAKLSQQLAADRRHEAVTVEDVELAEKLLIIRMYADGQREALLRRYRDEGVN